MALLLKSCTKCLSTEKYYAKGLCSSCYQKNLRTLQPDKYRAADRARWLQPRRREQDRERHLRHKDKRNALCRQYRASHLEALRSYDRLRYQTVERKNYIQDLRQKNLDKVREIDRNEYRRNKDRHIARVMARRAHKGLACPKWLTEAQKLALQNFYKNRPAGYHVDHIIPLKGRDVWGLHVPWNLQYLPAQENLKKGNKL